MSIFLRLTGLLILLSLVTGSRVALAQTERGVGWLSGSAGWQQERTSVFQNDEESTTLATSLTQGTFVRDNLMLGADLRLARSRNQLRQGLNFDAVRDLRETTVGATPFVRRFWGADALRGYVGGGLAITYGRNRLLTTNTQQRLSEQESTRWGLSPEFQAGLFYAINTRWGLELSARSGLFPISFTNLNLGLVVLTDVKKKRIIPASGQTQAQLSAGNWLLGGGVDLSNNRQQLISGTDRLTTVQRQATSQFTVSPSVGYTPGKRWVVGVFVPIRRQKLTNEFDRSANGIQTATVLTNSIGVEPFAKKYLSKTRFGPYVAGRAGWREERVSGGGAVTSIASGYNWRVSGGLAYLLGTHFIVEGELGSIGSEWSDTRQSDDTSREINLTLSLRPALSLTYVFL